MSTVIYMAHPVAGDVPANLARALRWLRWLTATSPETTYIAPWIAAIMSGEEDDDPAARARGLAHDVVTVRRCDGLVLVGGKISQGMAIERDAAISQGLIVTDMTDLGDEPPALVVAP